MDENQPGLPSAQISSSPPNKSTHATLFKAKGMYFFYYAALVSLAPFLVIYYRDLGLSGREIGFLTALPPLIGVTSAPIWSGLADGLKKHRQILVLTIAGTWLCVLVLTTARSFLQLGLVISGFAFFTAPIMPLVDHSVIGVLGARRHEYGKQRLWGSVSWGAFAAITGVLIDRYGLKLSFVGYLIWILVCLAIAWNFPILAIQGSAGYWAGLRSIRRDPRWISFIGLALLGGMVMSLVSNFLFLFMGQEGSGENMMGLALTVATISEIPILFISGELIRRVGTKSLLLYAVALYAVRLLAYAALPAPGWVLLLQLMHGPTYAAMWASGVARAGELAPEGLGATAQGIFSATLTGVGAALGSLLGGLLFDPLGGRMMFFWSGLGLGIILALFWLWDGFINRPTSHSH